MQFDDLKKYQLILASKSPRRQYLLKELGLNFEVRTKEVDESFPPTLKAQQIPLYLCEKKAHAFDEELSDNTIVITADTIVWVENQVLNKPENYDDAVRMLKLLSGKMHEVYTGVCLKSKHKTRSFYALTKVYFKTLSPEEIEFYIKNYNPYDKAGAYGAQEWIGYIAVEKIEGSYFNVMGLPVRELYEELLKF
ncbi:MAG: Maf-like protein [Bacteroidia bacterium]